jgi:ABC-2 type transport system ATP-binding protein
MDSNAIEIRNLTTAYASQRLKGVCAVDNLSLDVKNGEVFALLGPNGAGKTTLILTILGLLKSDKGEVRIYGLNPDDIKIKQRIGYLPENPSFSVQPYLNAVEYLKFHGSLLAMTKEQQTQEIERLCDLLELTPHLEKRISEYSKGMLQRLNIAQALLNNPDLIFLDEPILGLDPLGIAAVRTLILNAKKMGKTVFINSHLLSEVEKTCDRAGIIVNGSLEKLLTMEELALTLHGAAIKISNIDAVRKKIETLGTIEDKCLTVAVQHETEIEQVVTRIVEAGGKIVSVTPRVKNLEDYFVQLVGRKK